MNELQLKSHLSYLVLSGSIKTTLGQKKPISSLLLAISERDTVSCDSQLDLKSAMPRPTSWPYAEFHTYTFCDWMRTSKNGYMAARRFFSRGHARYCRIDCVPAHWLRRDVSVIDIFQDRLTKDRVS